MISTMAIDQAERRLNDFQQRCGKYGEAALHLAYHAALPVALNAEFLHLLRINFFLDPPEILPYTVEFEFLLSSLCREIDEGLYEIEPDIRDALLAGLSRTYDAQRTRDIATLLWQYVDHHSPWIDRVELERAQQLTALNFLNPEKAQQWLVTVETEVVQGKVAAREWFVAMRQDIENQVQRSQDEEAFNALVHALNDQSSSVRHRAVEALGRIGNNKSISVLLNALKDTSSKVRLSAALALGQIGGDEAVNALLLILQDEDSNVRASAAKALGQIGGDKAFPALLKALKDRNRTVRSTAAEALARMGHDNVIDASGNEAIGQLPDELPQFPEDQNQLRQKAPVASFRSLSNSQVWTFQTEIVRIGTLEDNDLVLPKEGGISRKHAEIFYRYSGDNDTQPMYFLRDFSRYGTRMLVSETEEWQKIHHQETMLPSGTQLKFGGSQNSALEFSIIPVEAFEQLERGLEASTENVETVGTVLWVDDHPSNNILERQALEALGVSFVLATSTKEALEKLDEQHFDTIISDMGRTPDSRAGYTLLDRLRSSGNQIPFVIYASSRDPAHVAESRRRGAVGCTNNPSELYEMVLLAIRQVESVLEPDDQNESSIIDNAKLRESQQAIQSNVQPAQVFISYARKDEVFYDQFVKHLDLLKQQRVIGAWHDRCSRSEKERDEPSDPFLEAADIILFLISADFLAADTSNGEIARALERHDAGEARLIPIILRPVDLKDSPLSKLQFLPKDGKPVTKWSNRDEAFLDVAQEIRKAAEQMAVRSQVSFSADVQGTAIATGDGNVVGSGNIVQRETQKGKYNINLGSVKNLHFGDRIHNDEE